MAVDSLDHLRITVSELFLESEEPSAAFLGRRILPFVRTLCLIMEDAMAWILFGAICRIVYVVYHYSWSEWSDLVVRNLFDWARETVPGVKAEIDRQTKEFAATADQVLHKDPQRALLLELPPTGRARKKIIHELQETANKENQKWKHGKASGIVYNDDHEHSQLLHAVYQAYSSSNPLHPGFWPKLNQCEAEVIAMTASLMHAPEPFGAVTSGGTESIILAVRAHLGYYGRRRSIKHPEIICSSSAHAALNKACEMFNIRLVVVDCNDNATFQLKPHLVRKRITSNTIMIYSSAPSYPHGVIDPIAELSDIAVKFGIGLHVDACLGGFVLAFSPDAPSFDFQHVGVTSMSADTHKYGYSVKGTSVVLYRNKELRHAQYFCYPHWTGGMYATPTIAGSRPGALTACAWASMVALGREGFEARSSRIVEASRAIAKGISGITGLKLMTP
ncbi:hypothetical protein MPSEU_001087300 [Mayamaea pseudoterrestris]|nr:hypothetical protein MPSEU_001087300 [Mayamaea pseudoterrestris]